MNLKEPKDISYHNAENQRKFDPRQLNDPVALKTKWIMLNKDKKYSLTYMPINQGDRIIYRPYPRIAAFMGGLVLVSTPIIVFSLGLVPMKFWPLFKTIIAEILGITLFIVLISQIIKERSFSKMTFDKYSGFFWKGANRPRNFYDDKKIVSLTKLKSIYALQFIKWGHKYVSIYELNIIKDNGDRINLFKKLNSKYIRRNAKIISEFLDKPVWDVSNF